MTFFKVLLCAALILQAVCGDSSSRGRRRNYRYDRSGQDLTNLFNSRVQKAERVWRPFDGQSSGRWPFYHSGVRVTVDDGSQWLVHKGKGYGLSSQTVVTDARHMSPAWRTTQTKDFDGRKTVSDFVRAGGGKYNTALDNCHWAARRMMNQ
ncbi:hypothetical protein XENORESO_002392 [Xenotaenia resolanae]|uniref:Uncharacterized protein n=1 Tax=Xenotaenia resolanae TaxID=208358 RepID=A0ABV0VNG1_9TELE